MRPRALDLYCGGGGVSEGLLRAGFDVVGVDLDPRRARAYARGPGNPERHERPATFVQADALTYPLDGFDFVWASPPCQAHTILRKLQPGKEYPDLIPATRERLVAAGIPYAIENVPGAPLAGFLVMLCGTMFGLQTPDGRAELRRHRLFETSWPIALRPACQHGHEGIQESLTVTGTGMGPGNRGKEAHQREKRRALSVSGHTSEISPTNWGKRKLTIGVSGDHPFADRLKKESRTLFSTDDARHAMGIDWMAMKDLSQAIPPAFAEWIGRRALEEIAAESPAR